MFAETVDKVLEDNSKGGWKRKKYHYFSSKSKKHAAFLFLSLV
jgi:hypothetical protein